MPCHGGVGSVQLSAQLSQRHALMLFPKGLLGRDMRCAGSSPCRPPLLNPLAPTPGQPRRVLNAIRGCAGFVRLHGEVPSWRQLGSGEVTTERPQAVAEVEQEFAEHWVAQQATLAAEPGAVITGQDRLRQAEPQFEHAAEAADVREQGMLRLSVFCGHAARIVAGGRCGCGGGEVHAAAAAAAAGQGRAQHGTAGQRAHAGGVLVAECRGSSQRRL